jgi:hypothetical protein
VHEGLGFGGVAEVGEEGAVDFDGVDGELAEVGEGGVAGSEVVDGDADAESFVLVEALSHDAGVFHEGALGDFEDEVFGVEAAVVEGGGDGFDEVGSVELAGGDVDGEVELVAVGVPLGHLVAGFA